MEFKQLQRYMAIVDHGSFLKAAKALGISQQALSASIRTLEREIGVTILDRGPGGVTRPTPYGRILLRHARAQEAARLRALRELHALRDARGGAVSMGIGESFASEIIATAVSRFHEARPDIKISLIEGYSEDLLEKLRRGQIDFLAGSIGFDVETDDLVQMTFYSRQDVVVARRGHPLADMENPELDQLAHYTWLVPASRPSDKEAILNAFAA
ncbi:MAG: LysR family transcriptional regulator, partial [Alphaproteobacteria bacterium]